MGLSVLASVVGLAWAGARVVSPAMPANALAPRWSPDGSRLAWELNAHACKRVLLVVLDERSQRMATIEPAAGGAARAVPLDARRPKDPCGSAGSGAMAGFSSAGPASASLALDWHPASPASGFGLFAFSGADSTRDLDLYGFELTSGARLAQSRGADGDPRWLPASRGRALVFSSVRTGDGDLYLLDTTSGEQRRLTSDPDTAELYAAPSPDGAAVVYVAHDDRGDHLWVLDDLDASSPPRQLTDAPGLQVRPSWSPDGSTVAYYANAEDRERFDLWVVARDGRGPRALARGVWLNRGGPAWLPDGSGLVAVVDDDARYNPVVRVNLATGAASTIATDTVGNGDHDVVRGVDGRVWLAVSALGRSGDATRDYRRIFVVPVAR